MRFLRTKRRGGINLLAYGFPLAILFIITITTYGFSQQYTAKNVSFVNSNSASGSTTITCPSNGYTVIQPSITANPATWYTCFLYSGCPNTNPIVINCVPPFCPFPFGLFGCNQASYLPQGFSVNIPNQISSSGNCTGLCDALAFFNFGGNGGLNVADFMILFGVAVALVTLAGLQVFGSGMSPEAIHILFITAMSLALWAILTGVSGYPSNPANLFVQLNAWQTNLGDSLYLLLSLVFMVTTLAGVSRGNL